MAEKNKLKVQKYKGNKKPIEGDTLGWSNAWNAHSNKGTGTGWRWEGGKWVQYKQGKRTGRSEKYRDDTNAYSKLLANIRRPFMLGPGMIEAYGATFKEMERRKKANQEHNYLKLLKEQLKKKKDLERRENLNFYSNPITKVEDRHVSSYTHYWQQPKVNEKENLKIDQQNTH